MNDFIVKGSLKIEDGIYKTEQYGQEVRKGVVRKDLLDTVLPQRSVLSPADKLKTYTVEVSCTTFASFYNEGIVSQTKISLQKNTTYRRIAGKNFLKDIKDFICPIAGQREASLVRKRLIGLQKIHRTLSDQTYNFSIDDS